MIDTIHPAVWSFAAHLSLCPSAFISLTFTHSFAFSFLSFTPACPSFSPFLTSMTFTHKTVKSSLLPICRICIQGPGFGSERDSLDRHQDELTLLLVRSSSWAQGQRAQVVPVYCSVQLSRWAQGHKSGLPESVLWKAISIIVHGKCIYTYVFSVKRIPIF